MNNWIERDLNVLWHPYTQMKDCRLSPPILIEKAAGAKLYDSQGNFYYDTISSWWCSVHGHNHPNIVAAINDQLNSLDHVLFAGFTHKPAINLAERLVSIAPQNLTRVFFSDNGSTAVETALKMSLQYWFNTGQKQKKKFVSLDMGYHGDTFGAMSVSGPSIFNKPFSELLFDSLKVPTPYCYRCPMGKEKNNCDLECTKPLENLFNEQKDQIAALILEPLLMGAAGMIVYPPEYLKKAAALASENDIHLIADEVATGFGRTGKMFACEHANVTPDFLCLSKGLTSGTLPLAATVTTEKIYQAFYDDYEKFTTFYHGHTFTANPIGCAAALASLDIFEQEKTLQKIAPLITTLHARAEDFKSLPHIGDVRYIGMVAAFELVKDKNTKQPFENIRKISQQIFQAALKENLILRPLASVIYLFLPLCLTHEELTRILNSTQKILSDIKIYTQ